jgi:glycosyltransferase involved in cell wall biosynthesis
MSQQPDISVIIPTRERPHLVPHAVGSALSQTLANIQVVVVVDGPDGSTREALAGYRDDPRLCIVELAERGGAPAARNAGVAHASAAWTALLDDDDEWLPEKLATQLALAKQSSAALPIVASRLFVRTPRTEFVLPRRLPGADQPISEYLTVRRGLFHGEGFIQTSTILAPTELLRQVPFTPGLRRCQELDWCLRALEVSGTTLCYAPEPLVRWNADENRPRISDEQPWREMFAWLQDSRSRMTRRAYAALAMSVVASMAATTASPSVFVTTLRDAHRNGRPGLVDYLTFLQIWMVPPLLRRTVRDHILGRGRHRAAAAS